MKKALLAVFLLVFLVACGKVYTFNMGGKNFPTQEGAFVEQAKIHGDILNNIKPAERQCAQSCYVIFPEDLTDYITITGVPDEVLVDYIKATTARDFRFFSKIVEKKNFFSDVATSDEKNDKDGFDFTMMAKPTGYEVRNLKTGQSRMFKFDPEIVSFQLKINAMFSEIMDFVDESSRT